MYAYNMNKSFILAVSFVLHWTIVIALSTYVFWGDAKHDHVYLICWVFLIVQWITINDCIISKIEKSLMYGENKPSYIHPSIQFYSGSNPYTFAISIVIWTAYCYNLFVVLLRNAVHPFVVVVFFACLITYATYYRIQEYNHITKRS